jgi:uncharacterized protein (DUF2461 family)
MPEFRGWPADATAFLAGIAADNTREFWERHRDRHATAVHAPTRALAAELEPEFGPVRVFRPYVNRRFRPDAPPYRTDTGGVASTAGGSALAVVLSATALTATAGRWTFDSEQLRRYRESVAGHAGEELAIRLTGLGLDPAATGAQAGALSLDQGRPLTGTPRGFRGDHPRIALLRRRALQLQWTWPLGEWLTTREPLERVRSAWRTAAGLVAWLDAHVGPAESTPPPSRPAAEAVT